MDMNRTEKFDFSRDFDLKNESVSSLNGRALAVLEKLVEHPVISEALNRLSQELPRGLKYHDFGHTLDVLTRTVSLALMDGVSEEDIKLLAIAAAWHDTGFIVQNAKNEPIAATWVRESMLRAGKFSIQQMKDVETAILDTQIQFDTETCTLFQQSTGRLSPWLLDADLANLGQKNFFEKSTKVYSELTGKEIDSAATMNDEGGRAYIAGTIRFLSRHNWHSNAARELLSAQKEINLKGLGLLLGQMIGGGASSLQMVWDNFLDGKL